jgi:hypothetical protein
MTFKDWADLASAIQSIAVSVAVVVGGGWALFQFLSLNSIAKARAELEVIKQSLKERGVFNLTIECQPIFSATKDGKWLLCTVHIENIGNGMDAINLAQAKFSATPIMLENNKAKTLNNQIIIGDSCQSIDSDATLIVPGEKYQMFFVLCLPNPGLYRLNFATEASKFFQKEAALQLFVSDFQSATWSSERIVFLE